MTFIRTFNARKIRKNITNYFGFFSMTFNAASNKENKSGDNIKSFIDYIMNFNYNFNNEKCGVWLEFEKPVEEKEI